MTADGESVAASDQLPEGFRGRYEVQRRLLDGMHGPSWLVRDCASGAWLVLRHLAATGGDALFAGNLRRITETALRCADAVPVRDLVEDGSAVWLVRDWVSGENLAEALAVLGRLTPLQGRAAIGSVCRGLLVEDRDLLVHGNLRPENVLIHPTGRVFVSDHGLRIVGTRMVRTQPFTYVAPELVAGEPPSPTADVYSLGALLYTALCGRYPLAFGGDAVKDRAVLAVHQIVQPPSSVDLSDGLGHVIWKALQPRAADRYPTAQDLSIALGRPGGLDTVAEQPRRRLRLFRR